MAGLDRAHAAGGSRIVASAARHDYRCGEAPFGGKLGAQTSRSLAPLDQLRHLPFAQAGLGQKLCRPAARTVSSQLVPAESDMSEIYSPVSQRRR